jgi:hypothetical protein
MLHYKTLLSSAWVSALYRPTLSGFMFRKYFLSFLVGFYFIVDRLKPFTTAKDIDQGLETFQFIWKADYSGRVIECMNHLPSLEHWDHGFESHSRHGCLCVRLFCV